MLPEILAGSYQRYKSDTNVFTTWLSTTAIACGYRPPKALPQEPSATPQQLPSTAEPVTAVQALTLAEKLRAQAEKKAKKREEKKNPVVKNSKVEVKPVAVPTTKHTVKTQELLRQAEAVARSSKFKVPNSIVQVVERAIRARKRCTTWFQQTGVDNGFSTDGHIHFIGILEEAMGILKPDFGAMPESANGATERDKIKQSSLHPATAGGRLDLSGLSNRFSNLDIEDPRDIVEDSATFGQSSATVVPTQTKSPPRALDVYELEYNDMMDRIFAVFCFFEDLHLIQDFLNESWKDYKAGTLDFVTVTAVTNAAFAVVRREEELVSSLVVPHWMKSKKLSYQDLLVMIFFRDSLGKSEGINIGSSLKITPFDNFIYLPTGRTLVKFEKFSAMKVLYPQPVPKARMSYAFQQELLELPEIKKMEKEDEFLTQLLMDSHFNGNIQKAYVDIKGVKLPMPDELSKGIDKLILEGEVSTWLVFASKVLLDIQDILGVETGQFHGLLLSAAKSARETIRAKPEGNVLVVEGERWKKEDGDDVLKIYIDCKTLENPIFQPMKDAWIREKAPKGQRWFTMDEIDKLSPEQRELTLQSNKNMEPLPPEYREMLKGFSFEEIKPSKIPNFIYAANPLYCGTRILELAIEMENAGLTLSNHHQSIFIIAHLYNALQQTKQLKTRWPEMDHVIEVHMKTFFAGKLPENESEIRSRCILQLGFSMRQITRNLRERRRTPFKQAFRQGMHDGPQMDNTKISETLRQYFHKKTTMDQCLHQIEALIEDETSQGGTPRPRIKARAYQRQLTPLQLLRRIQSYLPRAMAMIQLEYIELVRTCNVLLRKIRTTITDVLGVEHPMNLGDGDSNEPGFILMAMDILSEAAHIREAQEEIFKVRQRDDLVVGPQLELTGLVMAKFIEKLPGTASQEVL